MSKLFRRKTGLIIASGAVVGIDNQPEGKTVKISIREYNGQLKDWNDRIINAVSNSVDDNVAVGCIATAIGYQSGIDTIFASSVTTGNKTRYIEDIEVVTGRVYKAELKTETNEDGSQKLKRDGSPRKPHFDITIPVLDEEGHNVLHRIKIYNFKETADSNKETEIQKAERIFKNFVDKDETPVEATIVTRPGSNSSWESEYRGKIYQNFASDHLGKDSWDFNWLNEAQRTLGVEPVLEMDAPEVAQESIPAMVPTSQVSAVAQEEESVGQGIYGSGSIRVEDEEYL